ncbi:MAG: GAF domain-containing protein [Verrucomicrobiota bacterium JB022]|nr:GAF domain-containing protein [Verrucomicrobiota bacterium JB022]
MLARDMAETDIIDSLYRITSLVNQTQDPHEALELVVDEIMLVIPCHSAAIELINPESRELEIEVTRNFPVDAKQTILRMGEGVTGWVALHAKPLLIPDVRLDPRYVEVKPETLSEMAVPILAENGECIGVVNCDSEHLNAFAEQDLKVLSLLTNEAARVLNRLWLIKKLAQKADQLEALINTARSIVKKRELPEVLKSVVAEARELMGCRICSLFLLEEDGVTLTLRAIAGLPGRRYTEKIGIGDSAIGTAIRRHKQIEVTDLRRTEEHHFVSLIQSENLVSMLSCPIEYEKEVIGVLNAYTDRPHRFNNEEKRLCQTLASMAAVAIQNVRLYARIFRQEDNLRRNEKLTTLGLLSAEIAHEIRNPLTVIRLLFESLDLQFEGTDPRAKDVAIIGEKIDQLESIVSKVLSFGKSRENMRARYDLHQLVEDTLLLVRMKLQQGGIDPRFHRLPDQEVLVEVNKGQIQQAVLNLLINAMHAMPEGGKIEVWVHHEQRDQQHVAVIDIADTGKGVPEGIRERIFDNFLTGRRGGTGLGLAIVKRIMQSHNGDVELLTTSNKGTTMRLWLPLAKAV